MKRFVTLLAVLCPVGALWAHHSTTAYDHTRLISLTGVVSVVQWTNPHSWIHVQVKDEQGEAVTEWAIETGAPNINIRHGWKRDDVKVGDRISLNLYPHRDGSPHGTLSTITLADGRVLEGAVDFIRKDMLKLAPPPPPPPPSAEPLSTPPAGR
jgi:hypothetical protein